MPRRRRWPTSRATPTCPTRCAPTPTTRCTSTTRDCTTTSGAGATTSCTRCGAFAPARSPVADDVAELRREVCALHAELPRNGLVAWTSGNLSARVPDEELMVVKASGVPYDELEPDAIVVCDFSGEVVEGDLKASSDAATHGHIYREMPNVGGVAHTHSAYATAWSIHGEPIPCAMTAMADEFGGEIP